LTFRKFLIECKETIVDQFLAEKPQKVLLMIVLKHCRLLAVFFL